MGFGGRLGHVLGSFWDDLGDGLGALGAPGASSEATGFERVRQRSEREAKWAPRRVQRHFKGSPRRPKSRPRAPKTFPGRPRGLPSAPADQQKHDEKAPRADTCEMAAKMYEKNRVNRKADVRIAVPTTSGLVFCGSKQAFSICAKS